MNGQIAQVLPQSAWPAGGERVGIKLPDGTKLSCKPANLSTIGISASVPAAALEVDANPDANTAGGGGGDDDEEEATDAGQAANLPRTLVASCVPHVDGGGDGGAATAAASAANIIAASDNFIIIFVCCFVFCFWRTLIGAQQVLGPHLYGMSHTDES